MRAGKKSTGKVIWWALFAVAVLVVMVGFITPWVRTPRIPYPEGKQLAQLRTFNVALELFAKEFDDYPASDALDPSGVAYCGAMKLCEAMMGRDLLGFHSDSIFRADGKDAAGEVLYDPCDLSARKGPFLPPECVDALTLADIYGKGNTGSFREDVLVLCDIFWRKLDAGKWRRMPILYYKADTSKGSHDVKDPNNPDNIYNYKDNHALLELGVPGKPGKKHPLFTDPAIFYEMTRDKKVKTKNAPCNADSYILISASQDGLYGTKDDVTNFKR